MIVGVLNLKKYLCVGLVLLSITLSYSCWKRSSSSSEDQKINTPNAYAHQHIEEEVVGVVERTDLFLNDIKLNGYHQSMHVTIYDTIRNIYLVVLKQKIADSSKVLANFLVDANRKVILNPDGKLPIK